MDEIDEIPEFDDDITPFNARHEYGAASSSTVAPEPQALEPQAPEPQAPEPQAPEPQAQTLPLKPKDANLLAKPQLRVGRGNMDLVVVVMETKELKSDVLMKWVSEKVLQSAFHRVFVVGHAKHDQMQLLQKLCGFSTVVQHPPTNSWASGVLRHLRAVNRGEYDVRTRQVSHTFFVSATDDDVGHLAKLVEMTKANMNEEREIGLNSQELGLNSHWVQTDLVLGGGGVLSFGEYYEAMCWRPVPPSTRVRAVAGHCLAILTDRVTQIPKSFFDRALHIHSSSKSFPSTTADRFFDHITFTILSEFAPPIHE
jgi:hypothetical protein